MKKYILTMILLIGFLNGCAIFDGAERLHVKLLNYKDYEDSILVIVYTVDVTYTRIPHSTKYFDILLTEKGLIKWASWPDLFKNLKYENTRLMNQTPYRVYSIKYSQYLEELFTNARKLFKSGDFLIYQYNTKSFLETVKVKIESRSSNFNKDGYDIWIEIDNEYCYVYGTSDWDP